MGRASVCGDPACAGILVRQGPVVLCCTDGEVVAETVVALRNEGWRVAAFIGDLADPDVEAAALAMAAELFGADPIVVRRPADRPGPPAKGGTGSGTV